MKFERIHEWRTDDILLCIAPMPDTAQALVGSSDFQLYVVDLQSEKLSREPMGGDSHSSYVTGVAAADGWAVSGGYDRHLIYWDLASRQAIRSVEAHDRWIRRVLLTPDQDRVVSIGDDMQCKIWNRETGELLAAAAEHELLTPHHYPSMLYAVAVSADGKWLATGDRVGHVIVRNLDTMAVEAELDCPVMYTWDPRARRHSIGGIRSLAFSPDGSQLAVGGIGKIGNVDHLGGPARLEVFRWQTGERRFELEDNKRKGLIEQILWLEEGRQLLTVGGDHKGFLTLYDAEKGDLICQEGTSGHIHGCLHDLAENRLYLATHQRLETWTWKADEA